MQLSGQDFTEQIIERIRARVADDDALTRTALSREVCEWFNWRGESGRLKEMSARVALLKLERRGVIALPRARCASARQRSELRVATTPWPCVSMSLAQVGRVWLVVVDRTQPELSKQWWSMMQEHHPLQGAPLCGAQVRYLIMSQWGVLGGLSFSAAAWRLAARDRWIGWEDAQRAAGLSKIVANTRFLILPSVRVPNLASQVLSVALARVPQDWQARYGVTPVLAETFVDAAYRGTCYQAANWRLLGHTQGRGRQDRSHAAAGSVKSMWVYPLTRQWQAALLGTEVKRAHAATMALSADADADADANADWAEVEFSGVALEARLQQRLLSVARDFYARPTASIPQACGSRAKTKAAYRFLDHEDTTIDTLLQPHYRATENRLRKAAIVLAVQDTTSLNYSAHAATQGIGPIGSTVAGPQGIHLHSTLTFTTDGTPLGFLAAQSWTREPAEFGKKTQRHRLPIEAKESHKWLKSYHAVAAVQARLPNTQLVSVGDREADVYELFQAAAAQPQGPALLIRAAHDRIVQHEQTRLWATLQAQPLAGLHTLHVPRQSQRAARTATLAIRFAQLTLQAPTGKNAPAITVWALLAQEQDAPATVKEPLEWLLLTTLAVHTLEHAIEKLHWYRLRWGIEVFHRTLKSGCRIEQRQLAHADRLEACLAIDMVVAWRIHHLTHLGRELPDAPCTVYFEEAEWQALMIFTTKNPVPPTEPPPLRDVIHRIATLGGFLGRKGDGQPGTQTLWLGLQRLDDIAAMYIAMTHPLPKPHATHRAVSGRMDYG